MSDIVFDGMVFDRLRQIGDQSNRIAALESEIARLRLTDAEREAIRRLLHWVHNRPCSELPVDVETDHSIACEAFERLGGGG